MKKYLTIVFLVMLLFQLFASDIVYAKKTINDASTALNTVAQGGGLEEKEITGVVGNVIKTALGITGLIFFVLMVYSGITWMLAQGNDDRVQKSRDTMIAAVIGLVVVSGAYAISNFVQGRLIEGEQSALVPKQLDTIGDETAGCCYDWTNSQVGADAPSNVAQRITTYDDCKYFGEHDTESPPDHWSGPESLGYWQFFEGKDSSWCIENLPERNPL